MEVASPHSDFGSLADHGGCRDIQHENYMLRKALKECSSKTSLLLEQYRTEQEQKTAMKQLIRLLQSRVEEANARCVDALEEASTLRNQLSLTRYPYASLPSPETEQSTSPLDSPLESQLRRLRLPRVAERRGAMSQERPLTSATISASDRQPRFLPKTQASAWNKPTSLDTTTACLTKPTVNARTFKLSPLSTTASTGSQSLALSQSEHDSFLSSDSEISSQDSALDSSTAWSEAENECSPTSELAMYGQDRIRNSPNLKPAKRLPRHKMVTVLDSGPPVRARSVRFS